jgi:hypothetical protein
MTDTDDLTADDLEQLAQSLAVDGSLGRADTLRVVEVLRALARERKIWLWFATDLVTELQIATDLLGFDHERHREIQLAAVATSFADGRKRMDLVERIKSFEQSRDPDRPPNSAPDQRARSPGRCSTRVGNRDRSVRRADQMGRDSCRSR